MAEKAVMSARGALKEKSLQAVNKELQGWWTRPAAPAAAKQGAASPAIPGTAAARAQGHAQSWTQQCQSQLDRRGG